MVSYPEPAARSSWGVGLHPHRGFGPDPLSK